MVFTASKVWNDMLSKSRKELLYCELTAFKKIVFQRFFSKYENSNWNDRALFAKIAIHGGYLKRDVVKHELRVTSCE